jgi:hypothetical protein
MPRVKARPKEVSMPVKLILMARSAGLCNFAGCHRNLVLKTEKDGEIHLSETAHIYPLGKSGPRAKKGVMMPIAKKNAADNLLLLCPTHHLEIDKAPKSYPEHMLRTMKQQFEEKIATATRMATADVSFNELDTVCARFIADPEIPHATGNLTRTEIDAKLVKNDLSERTRLALLNGLSIAARVREYVSDEAANDSTFPDRLVFGFRTHYYKLRQDGLAGDELFEQLAFIAAGGFSAGASRNAAGQAVLSYLFELCEVFEQ